MIKALVLCQKRLGLVPGQRFRLEQWSPLLESQHGIAMTFVPFESSALTAILYEPRRWFSKALLVMRDTVRRREVLQYSANFDVVIVYREAALVGPAIYERLLARTGVPI